MVVLQLVRSPAIACRSRSLSSLSKPFAGQDTVTMPGNASCPRLQSARVSSCRFACRNTSLKPTLPALGFTGLVRKAYCQLGILHPTPAVAHNTSRELSILAYNVLKPRTAKTFRNGLSNKNTSNALKTDVTGEKANSRKSRHWWNSRNSTQSAILKTSSVLWRPRVA